MTITGITADSAIGGGKGSKSGRRSIAIAAMLAGAVVGAAFVVHHHIVYPLAIALVLIAIVAMTTWAAARSNPAWTQADA
jgi:hypothetical protein